MYLQRNLTLIRKKWRLTMEGFGEVTGANKNKISSYERGTAEPNLEFMARLYEMSGLSTYELVTGMIDIAKIPDDPLTEPLTETSKPASKISSQNNQIPTQSLENWIKQMESRVSEIENRLPKD